MANVAFLGLGVMGAPMAGHLAKRGGHTLAVYNRTTAKAQAWVAANGSGRVALTPADAARDADFVFCCVGNDDDLRQVTIRADGAFSTMRPGAIFIDNTTASADVARELAAVATAQGCHFLDAPVSGGQAGAENGQLTVMVGGDAAAFARAQPVIAHYAKMVQRIGPSGAGQLTKMVNQIAIAGLVQGLAEAIHFGQSAGLDMAAVMATISKGAAQSWQMENRWKTMDAGKFEFGFAVDWMRKDLRIAMEQAKEIGAPLPVTELVDQFYGEVQKLGGKRWDTSSLIRRFRKV